MCTHNHFLHFSRVGNDKHFAAEGKTEMGRFNDLFDTTYFNGLLTPINDGIDCIQRAGLPLLHIFHHCIGNG